MTVVGILFGVFCLVAIRFATYKSGNVHYHANFSLYINGKRDEFKNFTFYEEVAACANDLHDNPKNRVHMHDQNSSLIHIHAHAVTWGHFFANLGYGITDESVTTDDNVYVNSDENKLRFILNGKQETVIANKLIKSEDKLLINFGNENSETLQKRFSEISSDAKEYNGKFDPSGCSGGEKLTPFERLKKSFP